MTGRKSILRVLAYVGGFICAFVGVELLVGFFVGPLLLGPIADSEFFAGGSLLFSLFAAGGVVWWGARSLQGSRPSPDAFRSTAPSRHQVIATLGTPQAAPMRNRQVIATFRRTTGRSAQRIFRRGDSFMIESHGPFSAADVMRYDEQGQLRWVNDGTRASVDSMACRPQGLASSAADTAPQERKKPPEAHAPKATSAGEAKTPRAAVVSGSAASRPGTASALAAPLEAGQPAHGPVVIATFGPTTHWSGRVVTYEGGQIFIEGHGQVTANAIMYYDRCGNLTWAHAGLRKRVEAMAIPAGGSPNPRPSATPAVPSAVEAEPVEIVEVAVVGHEEGGGTQSRSNASPFQWLSPGDRRWLVAGIAQTRRDRTLPLLTMLAEDEDPVVAAAAAKAAAAVKGDPGRPPDHDDDDHMLPSEAAVSRQLASPKRQVMSLGRCLPNPSKHNLAVLTLLARGPGPAAENASNALRLLAQWEEEKEPSGRGAHVPAEKRGSGNWDEHEPWAVTYGKLNRGELDPVERVSLIECLAASPSQVTSQRLLALASDGNPAVAERARWALGRVQIAMTKAGLEAEPSVPPASSDIEAHGDVPLASETPHPEALRDPLHAIPPVEAQSAQPPDPAERRSAPPDPEDSDPIQLIRSLGQLRDEGLLTDSEFEAKKAEILRRL